MRRVIYSMAMSLDGYIVGPDGSFSWSVPDEDVFSTTLSEVQGKARLASDGLVEKIRSIRANPEDGDIAIGGVTLAAEAAALGLIDEYRIRVYPVLVGGGIPFFHARNNERILNCWRTVLSVRPSISDTGYPDSPPDAPCKPVVARVRRHA